MPTRPIVVMDSGVGGVAYAVRLRERYPGYHYVQIADSANFPYGLKSKSELESLSRDLSVLIRETFHPMGVLVACNTATLNAFDAIKETFAGSPVVGVRPVEGALTSGKPERIAVIATAATLASDAYARLEALCRRNGGAVFKYAAGDLVTFVENKLFMASGAERLAALDAYIKMMERDRPDRIVLGCTHFLFLKEEIAVRYPSAAIIDSLDETADEVGNQLQLTVGNNGLERARCRFFQTSAVDTEKYRAFAERYGFTYDGVLQHS